MILPDRAKNWVLMRGLMSESYHWWEFLPLLKERFPDHGFHTADLIGNGPFGKQITPLRIDRNVHALRSQVKAPGKKILFGFSIGGMLALEWAYAHPEEVEAVVLINCSLGPSPVYHRLRPAAAARILRFAALERGLSQFAAGLSLTSSLDADRCNELAVHWSKRNEEHPVNPLNFFAQVALAARIRMRPEPPKVPVLLISSAKDEVVNPECSRLIASRWNVPHVIHPTAGHDLSLVDPQWLVDQLTQWQHLRELRRPDEPVVLKGKRRRTVPNASQPDASREL